MFQNLRQTGTTFFAKALLFLLVASFGLWGIGDIFRHGGQNIVVAEAAGIKIHEYDYKMALERKTDEMRSMLGSSYTPELLKSLNLPGMVLNGMIDQILVAKEAQALGIRVSDEAVQNDIRRNAAFQDSGGRFDINLFQRVLGNAHVSEKQYYSDLKNQLAAKLLLNTFDKRELFPDSLPSQILSFQKEEREASVYFIPTALITNVPEPSSKELEDYFTSQQDHFVTPETRASSYLALNKDEVTKSTEVAQSDIESAYHARQEEFHRPETRELEQLLYDDEAKAKKAHALLKNGKAFKAVAAQIPPENAKNIALGSLKKADIVPEAADMVYSLKAGDYSEPVKSDFGWHIFRVVKVIPEGTAPLADVKDDLVKELREQLSEDRMYKQAAALEDALAANGSLEDAGKSMGLTVKKLPAMSENAITADGKIAELPPYSDFIKTVFSTDDKTESSLITSSDGSYYVVRVDAVTPARPKPLKEVSAEVTNAWKSEKQREMVKTAAETLAKLLKDGKSAADALKEAGIQTDAKASGRLKRDSKEPPATSKLPNNLKLPPEFVEEIFALPKGGVTEAHAAAQRGYLIAVVSQVHSLQPEAGSPELVSIRQDLDKEQNQEFYQQYMIYLRSKYNVIIHPERIARDTQDEQ